MSLTSKYAKTVIFVGPDARAPKRPANNVVEAWASKKLRKMGFNVTQNTPRWKLAELLNMTLDSLVPAYLADKEGRHYQAKTPQEHGRELQQWRDLKTQNRRAKIAIKKLKAAPPPTIPDDSPLLTIAPIGSIRDLRQRLASMKEACAKARADFHKPPTPYPHPLKPVRNPKTTTGSPPPYFRGMPSDQFFLTRDWLDLRYQIIKHYGRRCQCCGATPDSGAIIQVDHIKPRSKFPALELDKDNLQVLCRECNIGKFNTSEEDWRPPSGL